MHNFDQEKERDTQENIFRILMSKFLPYWPLFALLAIMGLVGSWLYLNTVTPIYEASAKIMIKDERKGVDDADLLEAINPFQSKKIVENEIEVLKSKDLMVDAVQNLHLYVAFYQRGFFKDPPIYNTSPILVVVRNADVIRELPELHKKKFHFVLDPQKDVVKVNDVAYPLDKWIKFEGINELMFKRNNIRPKEDNKENKDYYFIFGDPKSMAQSMAGSLLAEPASKQSTVVSLLYYDPIPARAIDILNYVMFAYNKQGIDERNSLATNTLLFIEDRMKAVELELDELEREIQVFRSQEGAVDLSEQGKLYLQDVGQYDKKIEETRRQLAILGKVESYIISKGSTGVLVPSTLGIEDSVLNQLLEKLYETEIEYDRLIKTTPENNPIVVALRNDIDKIRPSILENIQSLRSNLNASLGNLTSTADQSNKALKTLPEKERALLEISRRKAIKNDLFAFLQQKREETALTYAPSEGENRVVDSAEASWGPVSPKRSLTYLIGVLVAMGIGLAYIFGKEMMNSKVLFREEVGKYVNAPVLEELPHVTIIGEKKGFLTETRLKTRKLISYFLIKIGLPKERLRQTQEAYNTFREDDLMLPIYFNRLGAKLGLFDLKFRQRNILVTSSISGEGKSFISYNLSKKLALSGKKVALVDCDLVNFTTTKNFKLNGKPGLFQFLSEKASLSDIVYKDEASGLFVIPTGINPSGNIIPTQLMLNGKLEVFMSSIKTKYDYIILDSAPINLMAEVKLFSEYSDVCLYVIRHGVTPLNLIKHLEDSTLFQELRNKQIIFNDVKKRGLIDGDYGYGYSYRPYGY